MKKYFMFLFVLLVLAALVWGESYHEDRSWTTSFTFLGGDSTKHVVAETSYVRLNIPTGKFRFNKMNYQSDAAFGSMAACTVWVQIQEGPGSDLIRWDTLKSFVITGDLLYETSGWDLVYTWAADSGKLDVRMRVIVQTDSTGNAPLTDYVDSSYSITHKVEAWGHD